MVIGSPIGAAPIGGAFDPATFDRRAFQTQLALVSESLIIPQLETAEGVLIESNSLALAKIIKSLEADWALAFQLEPRQWEELMAAAYAECGYEVTLTPRSGDDGRDLVAERRGFGCIRVLNQVKRYKPDHLVTANDARALLGVLSGDAAASKAVLTTTSSFAPRILDDPAIGPAVPTRLQLINGADLQEILMGFSAGESPL